MQLDLLSWRPPFDVIPFPTIKRIGHIRRIAARIDESRTDREADAYWNRASDGLRRQMEKAGIDDHRIETEVNAFRLAVMDEIARRARLTAIQPDGGAA